jgi:arylsulfatase A-like enzyme
MSSDNRWSRRTFIKRTALGGATLAGGGLAYSLLRGSGGPSYPPGAREAVEVLPAFSGEPPNIVLINADDLGYGDLSCYGSMAIRTPNIDGMAESGMLFTDFHACDAVCTPSRAGLMTGRYPARMMLDTPLGSSAASRKKKFLVRLGYFMGRLGLLDLATRRAADGLHQAEITLAEALKQRRYRTCMVGKWHLGDYSHEPGFNPIRHGFDVHFGVPYSNDMAPLPLYRGEAVEDPDVADQATLTGTYTREAVAFIESSTEDPFFLYLAHTFPHRPLSASEDFSGRSAGGLYGDVVEELDWSVGEILAALDRTGRSRNTIVFFTSDNGPWYQGSPAAFRGRKGQTFEGGHRVPFIAWAPGRIPAGSTCHAPVSNLDLFPTCLAAAGLSPPTDRIIDGEDLNPLFTGDSRASPHPYLYLYHHGVLEGVRSGKWKYLRSTSHYTWPMPVNKKLGSLANHTDGPLPLLHNLSIDPGEAYNLAGRFPEIVNEMETAMESWETQMRRDPLGFGS